MRPARRLILLFLVLGLPFLPCRAQNQSEAPSPLLDVLSPETHQFNRLSDFGLRSSSVPLDLIPTVGPLPTSLTLPALFASSGVVPPKITQPSPRYNCPTDVQINLISVCLFPPPPKFAASEDKLDIYPVPPIQPARHPREKFHWGAALEQSFGFLVVGHALRLANDDGARYLLIHKPFWYDYWASADNFHKSHWGDGDSFIVNYIGHPMEGAVYGDIFLNNDPKGRS